MSEMAFPWSLKLHILFDNILYDVVKAEIQFYC